MYIVVAQSIQSLSASAGDSLLHACGLPSRGPTDQVGGISRFSEALSADLLRSARLGASSGEYHAARRLAKGVWCLRERCHYGCHAEGCFSPIMRA